MNKRTTLIWPSLLVLLFSLSAGADKKKEADWTAKMAQLRSTVSDLISDLVSTENLGKEKVRKRVIENATKLSSLAHDIEVKTEEKDEAKAAPDFDPTLQFVAEAFEEETTRAVKALKQGHVEYAARTLKAATQYCIACHTRSAGGPEFKDLGDASTLKKLSEFDAAEYLAAVRSYDEALKRYEKIVRNPKWIDGNPYWWERAFRRAVAILIRVKQDPQETLNLASYVAESSHAPLYVREYAKKWVESARKWKTEAKREAKTVSGLLGEGRRLVAAAREMQEYPMDRTGDLLYLRATAVLHDLMAKGPEGKQLSEALYLTGLASEVLQDAYFWTLHELYYESCIRHSPDTPVARQCYVQLESAVYAAHSGSAGVFLTDEVRKDLAEMKELAGFE